jgi:hypothetical protein
MSVWLDVKYAKMISNRFDGWKEKSLSPFQVNCRCILCGDSVKKNKKRGYLYEKKGSVFYHCFNCSASMPFGLLLKELDPFIHKQYTLEWFKENSGHIERPKKELEPDFRVDIEKTLSEAVSESYLDSTVMVMSLDDSHPAKKYLISRCLPSKFLSMFHYTDTFFKWSSTHTDKFHVVEGNGAKDHPRIIMPWYNKDGYMFAYQARSLNGEEPKYYTIVLNDSFPRFFGMERVDFKKKIYCVEGPIDSLFLPNAIAVGSSALTTFDDNLKNVVYCFDNESRNSDIVKLIGRAIKGGKKVFIPPDTYRFKDLNEAVQGGMEVSELQKMIDKNTFVGPAALIRFNMWKRS